MEKKKFMKYKNIILKQVRKYKEDDDRKEFYVLNLLYKNRNVQISPYSAFLKLAGIKGTLFTFFLLLHKNEQGNSNPDFYELASNYTYKNS